MKKITITIIFVSGLINILCANDLSYGLYIKSYSNLGKDRTSLVLNDNEPVKFKEEITISFDMFVRKETVFGNVIRIINSTGEAVTLNFSAGEKDNRYPSITLNDNFYPISNTIEFEKWFSVQLRISTQKDSLYLNYHTVQKSYQINLARWNDIKISFGVCPFPGFETFEAAPVNIKDIKILSKDKLIRHWALKEHNDSICYDLVNYVPAISKNPQWLIDTHTNWTQIYSKNFPNSGNPQYAYNPTDNILYIVPDEKTVIFYDPRTKKDSVIHVKGGYPAGISSNELIYDPINKGLVSYSLDERTLSRFSFKDQTWSKDTPGGTETRFWHHTASFNEKDTTLYTFGGYGYYKYKNDLYKINLNDDNIINTQILTISPRYSPASVIVDNKLYVFGGRGSDSGKQEVNPHFNYDFYSIDLQTDEVKQLWTTTVDADFLPCGNMIFNPDDSCFYFLTNIENGTLCRIKADRPGITKVSNGIKQKITADFLFYTLFFSPKDKKIYALFSSNLKTGSSKIAVYEIDYPPLSYAEISQQLPSSRNNLYLYSAMACVLLILLFLLYIYLKKKSKKKTEKVSDNEKKRSPRNEDNPVLEKVKERRAPEIIINKKTFDRSRHCISLLGGFNVMDKEGNNITQNFTPILKNLLLLILLYSENEEKGIKDNKIDNILWPDKDHKAARNNRNVSLTRLKLLLENVGEISLTNNSGFWRISFQEHVFCDYHVSIRHLKQIKTDNVDPKIKSELVELLMYGPLLPYTQVEWLDKFKSNYSNDAIDVLYNMLTSHDATVNEESALEMADTMFLFDSLNEEALKIKCSILYNSGKKGLAKKTYDIFVKEYNSLLGENYKYSLTQILDQDKNL